MARHWRHWRNVARRINHGGGQTGTGMGERIGCMGPVLRVERPGKREAYQRGEEPELDDLS